MICDANRLYAEEAALHETDAFSDGFQWVVGDDTQNCIVAWIRKSQDQQQRIVVAANLTPAPRSEYRIGVPESGFYREIFNSDADWYGGSGSGNQGGAYSLATASHGFDNSISVFLPPLAVVAFKPVPPTEETTETVPSHRRS
jgi:1,4-alpha-glucan branching enzyme